MRQSGQELMRIIEDVLSHIFRPGAIPGSAIGGQITDGPQGPLPRGGAPQAHTHPLSDVEESGANDGDVPAWNNAAGEWQPVAPSTGTVTSVGLTMPTGVFDVSGSPITGAGTLAVAFDTQAANTVLKGPDTGSPAAPTFAPLVAADIPNLPASKITSGQLSPANGGTGINNGTFTLTVPQSGTAVMGGGGGSFEGVAVWQGINLITQFNDFKYHSADNELRLQQWRAPEISTPSTPASGFGTWFTGNTGIASHIDDGGVVREMIRRPIGAGVFNSAAQSIGNNSFTDLTFDSETFDDSNFHSTSSNTNRLTVPIAGTYLISGGVRFASNTTGNRQVRILLNGTTMIARDQRSASTGVVYSNVTTTYRLNASDYVTLNVFQDSGGNLNVEREASWSPEFRIYRLGD